MDGWMDAIVTHLRAVVSLFPLSPALIRVSLRRSAIARRRPATPPACCPSYYLPHYARGRRRLAPIVAAVMRCDQNGASQTMTMNFF